MHLTGSQRGVKLECDRKEIVMEGKKKMEKKRNAACYKHESKFETINRKEHKSFTELFIDPHDERSGKEIEGCKGYDKKTDAFYKSLAEQFGKSNCVTESLQIESAECTWQKFDCKDAIH